MKIISGNTCLAIVLASLVILPLSMNTANAAEAEALARAKNMLRQMAAERDSLKSRNASLEAEIDKYKAEAATLKSKNKGLSKDINNTDKILERYKETDKALREHIERQNERAEEIIAKFRLVVDDLRQVEAERALLKGSVGELDNEVKMCAEKNVELYETSLELLDQYKNKGVWSAMMQKEPVTGLKNVEIENLVQEYRNRLRDEKYVNMLLEMP